MHGNYGIVFKRIRRHFIDSSIDFDDYLILRNAHFAYSTLCIVYFVSSNRSLTIPIIEFHQVAKLLRAIMMQNILREVVADR